MANKGKEFNSLCITLSGLIGFLVFFVTACTYASDKQVLEFSELMISIVFGLVVFTLFWGIPKGIYWIYCGFKEDREN
jgi:hypothetical protein